MKLNVLMLTPISGYGGFNTSIHRVESLKHLNYNVHVIDSADDLSPLQRILYRFRNKLFSIGLPISLPDFMDDQGQLIAAGAGQHWDVIWLEKSLKIDATTLMRLKQLCPTATIVGFSPDDMFARHNQSLQFIASLPYYDLFLTTKSYNVKELGSLGCSKVVFVGNGYQPEVFRPMCVSKQDLEYFGGDVGFIGTFEKERYESMLYLARHDIKVRVWGWGWDKYKKIHPNLVCEGRPLYADDLVKAINSFRINLGFLRKINRDLQTTRSVEIPGCGAFMLAERTTEHLEMFKEGFEAEFFASDDELLKKIKKYLLDDEGRQRIASGGLRRCIESGYRNVDRMASALKVILETRK